jgi:hypothetical protein
VAVNGYITVPEFKAWREVDDTVDDVVIDESITAASRGIDNFCRTRFWKTAAGTSRLFDTGDTQLVRIGDAAAVTAVATDTDGDGVFETVWAATDYQLLPLNPAAAPEPEPYTKIHAVGTLTFPRVTTGRHGRVQVTGTWGWPSIPSDVRQACLLVTARLVKRRQSPEGVAGFDEFGTIRISNRDDPDAVRYLTPYRTMRRAGGWAIA